MNAGTSSLRSSATNVDALLKGTDYFKYESGIEEGVHGYVHCTVGPTCPVAHMGDVPLAGNDPVFYHHHANIDRLWACWQGLHGTPKGAWQQQQFSFVDETGTMQTKPVSFVVDPSALGYAYDNATSCSRPSTTVAAAPPPAAGGARALVHKSPAVPITKPQTVVDLDIPPAPLAAAVGDPRPRGARRAGAARRHRGQPPGRAVRRLPGEEGLARRARARGHDLLVRRVPAPRHERARQEDAHLRRHDALRALGGAELRATGLSVIVEATEGRDSSDPAAAARLAHVRRRRLPRGVQAAGSARSSCRRRRGRRARPIGVSGNGAGGGCGQARARGCVAPPAPARRAGASPGSFDSSRPFIVSAEGLAGLDERAHQRLADLVVASRRSASRDRGRGGRVADLAEGPGAVRAHVALSVGERLHERGGARVALELARAPRRPSSARAGRGRRARG
jgi:hypothetical protein